ncbi:MAG: GAF domain-containing protein [Terriglobales bacterium]
MSEAARIREIVERVVAEVFAADMPRVQAEVVQRVLQELQPLLAPSPQASPTGRLKTAISSIHQATAQSDILRALLDAAVSFSGRAAIFVVRGNSAMGWQGRGFRDNDAIRLLALDLNIGLAGRAYQQHVAIAGPVAQFEARFMAGFGAPVDGNCLVLPLLIRERVTALLYADAGTQPGNKPDVAALELLVRTAGLWIELVAMRKAGAPAALTSQHTAASGGAAARSPAAVPIPEVAPAVPSVAPPAAPLPPEAVPTVVMPAPKPESTVGPDDDLHRKAQRFARLLVDEIKLYNQAKVNEGKQNRDLYDRLKDDIEKSRATYDKRYAQTPVAAADYFSRELVRILADNDPALLGINFPR